MTDRREPAGFTLVEMLSTILLLAIVSAVAISRLDLNSFRSASFEQELRAVIRFAQKFAIASGCDVQVNVDAVTDSYALNMRNDANLAAPASCLTAAAAFGTALPNLNGGNVAGNAPAGTDITAGLVFIYNRRGVPSASGTIVAGGQSIVIEAGTGYVH
jgi:MSHA pilin protein MshC